MPSYDCPDCNDSFDSREARNQHRADVHRTEDIDSLPRRLIDIFSSKKKFSALIFGIIMVGLPLGGVIFYSSLAPETTPSSGDGSTYTQTPPVGQGLTSIPSRDGLPPQPIIEQELSDDEQVQILVQGGPTEVSLQGGVTIRPAALVQYSCTDCPDTVQQLESFAQEMNQNGNWVYLAPNTGLEETIAMTTFYGITRSQSSATFETANTTEMKSFVCDAFAQVGEPIVCLEDAF